MRKGKGLTQADLGDAVGISRRMVAYYEQQDAQPPGPLLAKMARVLGVTTDELLGVKPAKDVIPAPTARLRKRLHQVELLPPADQRAVLKFVDALLQARSHGRQPGSQR